MSHAATYTVTLRGQPFSLSRAQLEAEPGNILEAALLGDFQEGQTRSMEMDRHPAVFKVIVEHLSGYTVLPLRQQDWESAETSEEKFLRLLKDDARYYGLEKLCLAIAAEETRLVAEKEKEAFRRPLEQDERELLISLVRERLKLGRTSVSA